MSANDVVKVRDLTIEEMAGKLDALQADYELLKAAVFTACYDAGRAHNLCDGSDFERQMVTMDWWASIMQVIKGNGLKDEYEDFVEARKEEFEAWLKSYNKKDEEGDK